MFGKFIKYFFLDKNGRKSWDDMRMAKKARKDAAKRGDASKKGIPILNTPFTAKPGESGLIFPDSNPEEQINLIEMAIGEAKRIEAEPLVQLAPPDPKEPARLKKKTITPANTTSSVKPIVDVKIGGSVAEENTYSSKHSNQKIEAIYEAMKVYHAKQSALDELDGEAREKLKIMADVMMSNKE